MKSNLVTKLVLASSLMANFASANSVFVGFDGVYNIKSELELDAGNVSGKIKDSTFGLGLKVGYDFDLFRVYGEYLYKTKAKDSYSDNDGESLYEWNAHQFLIGADYTPRLMENFKFVLGAYTGISRLNYEISTTDIVLGNYDDKVNKTGWLLGAKIGGIYELNSNNEIEFGVKGDYVNYGSVSDYDGSLDFTEMNYGLYLGYNFKF
ncbi:MAG: hypothetical protein IKH66_03185 [Campylobacter sp.]|nr:hypothetical protein [Campylobacter sp.]